MSRKIRLAANTVSNTVTPKLVALDDDSRYPRWRFEKLALSGDFSLANCTEKMLRHMLEKFKALEKMTWHAILQATHDQGKSRSHPIEIYDLTKRGLKAFREMFPEKTNQPSELFSLALNNKNRVIGIREENIFYIIWLDHQHEFVKTKYNS